MESLKALPYKPQNFCTHPGMYSSPCPTVQCHQGSVLCSLSSRTATGTHECRASALAWPAMPPQPTAVTRLTHVWDFWGLIHRAWLGPVTQICHHTAAEPHRGSGWRWVCFVFHPTSFEDNGMFSAGPSARVLICVNLSSRLTKIFLWETEDKLAAQQHYQNPWDLSQSLSLAAAQGTSCTLKSEVFYCTFRVHVWTFHHLFPCQLDTEHRKRYLA